MAKKLTPFQKKDRAYKDKQKAEFNAKTYKGEWYTLNSIFGNDWAVFYCLLGGREAGKSYAAMKHAVVSKLRKPDSFKFYWFRLTDNAVKNLLVNGADKFIDPDIKRNYNVNTFVKGSTVYTYTPVEIEKPDGSIKIIKKNVKEFCDVLSCSTFYNTKGVGYFDNEYKGEYFIILDEMNREQSERNTFDIVYNFVNLLENVARSTKHNIKVIMIGNTLDEASDILSAFNFIPDTFGRYKLRNKRCVIDYIMPSEAYKKRREGTLADLLMPEASTFTNEVEIDRTLLVNKRRAIKPQYIVKFKKTKDTWFTVWNDNIVKPYNGENLQAVPMVRYLDEVYNDELAKAIRDMFDARAFKYTAISTFKRFQKQLRLIKSK